MAKSRGGLWFLGALAALVAGCWHAPVAEFDERAPRPWASCDALVSPAVELPVASAPRSVMGDVKEPRGLGFYVGYAHTPFTEFSTMASRGALAGATPAKGYWTYSDLWDPSFGVSVNLIASRPIATSVSSGDTYGILCFDYVTFAGRQVSGVTYADDMTWYGLWAEAKTMLNPPRKRPSYAPKAYVRYGVGLAMTPDVNAGVTPMYIQSVVPGARAGVGVEIRKERIGLFLDVGAQISGAPDKATTSPAEVGDAESAFCLPVRIGLFLF